MATFGAQQRMDSLGRGSQNVSASRRPGNFPFFRPDYSDLTLVAMT